jgi:4-hydroxythreonine-4-phosphate dehydrogenase
LKNIDLVITPGDPDGIGPEVTAKAIAALLPQLRSTSIVMVGSRKAFKKSPALLKLPNLLFIEPPSRSSGGYQSGWAIETASQFVMAAPRSRLLVTGPISKERLQEAGFKYQGHTDFLAHLTHTAKVTMMLANDQFRVALVTNHCPLSEVSKRITPQAITQTFLHAYQFCENDLGKARPKIAILGLNPHAGESGIIGREEEKVIIPTLLGLRAQFRNAEITGPHPADSFFAIEQMKPKSKRQDLIIALYHDQGLIPVKLSNFSQSMNMTLGLPIVRTSVDHGTAFDIAGKNKADPGSMIYAIQNGLHYLARRRKS